MGDRLLAEVVGAFHTHDVVSRLAEDMCCGRESVFSMFFNVTVGLGYGRRAIAE